MPEDVWSVTQKLACSLSLDVLGDGALAARATLLFCLTPASVFYSVVYTESVFALAAFSGMRWAPRRPWLAAGAFALATAGRSNGALPPLCPHMARRAPSCVTLSVSEPAHSQQDHEVVSVGVETRLGRLLRPPMFCSMLLGSMLLDMPGWCQGLHMLA